MNDDFVELGVIKNFNEVCRLCLAQGGVLSRIFESSNSGEETLSIKIEKCVSLQVVENDGLPSLICEHCVLNVDRSLQFKERCLKTDTLLRSYLRSTEKKDAEDFGSSVNIKTEVKSEPEDSELNDNEVNESRETEVDEEEEEEEGDGEEGEGEEEQSEEVVMVVDPFSIHLDNYDDDSSEANHDSNFPAESTYSNEDDEIQQSQLIFDDKMQRRHFNCNICNLGFGGRQQLERHKQIHTSGSPYPCDYCDETFEKRCDLKIHWETHKGSNAHMCDVCGAPFSDEPTLMLHSVIHERVRPFNCPTCNKSFYYRSDLRKHAIIHTGIRPYECSICKKSFTRSTNLNKHARIHTGNRPHICPVCNKMFGTRSDLKRHEVVHTGLKSWVCSVCFIPFNRKDKLTRHEKLHSGAPRPFPCSECPTSFLRKEELTKHTQFHHYKPPSPEALALLNARLKKPVSMNGNPELIYKKDMERGNATFKTLVKQAFNNIKTENENSASTKQAKLLENVAKNNELEISINVPSDDKDSSTSNSDSSKPSNAEELLNPPVVRPAVPRQYQCDICCKIFADCRNLRKHKVIHSGIKPFKCIYCEKCFYRRRELNRHLAVHTGFKPFLCSVCHKSFSRSDKLAKHVKTHQLFDYESNNPLQHSNNNLGLGNGVIPSLNLSNFTKLLFSNTNFLNANAVQPNSSVSSTRSESPPRSESVVKLEKNPEIIFFPVGKS